MKKTVAFSIILSFLSVITLPAQAAMLGTNELVQQHQVESDRAQLNELLQREDVKSQFEAMGVSPDEVEERVAALTDAEVQQLNQQMADLPAGGDVLSLIVLIFIVFIITDVIGATDIFPFVDPV